MIASVTPPEAPFAAGLAPWAQNLPEYISPTAAKYYLSCSLRFWFERVACIPKPTTPALHLGKAVHAALQSFHLARWRGGDDSPETVAAAFQEAFQRLERDEGPVSHENDEARQKCRQCAAQIVSIDFRFAAQEWIRRVFPGTGARCDGRDQLHPPLGFATPRDTRELTLPTGG